VGGKPLLADYGYIGLLLVVAVFFVITTLLLPFSLSLPARLTRYFRRFQQYLQTHYPFLVKFMPPLPSFPKFMQIAPYNPTPVKGSTFECGMETIGKAWVRFNFRYYFYALVFIALDVLVVFLYPWAVDLKGLGLFGLIGVGIFIFIVIIGYIYAWKKKVLEWK
jgi:NADH-quinone oxidoreductase subunit A